MSKGGSVKHADRRALPLPSRLVTCWCVLGVLIAAATAVAQPIRDLPDLESVTFWERTGGFSPDSYFFTPNASELLTRLSDPLTASNSDVATLASGEYYDLYYSDSDGTPNINGAYLSIEARYDVASGGALNVAEVTLNFFTLPDEYGLFVSSFVAQGAGSNPASVDNAVDTDLQTHTSMGETTSGPEPRLRVTIGFVPIIPVTLESFTVD